MSDDPMAAAERHLQLYLDTAKPDAATAEALRTAFLTDVRRSEDGSIHFLDKDGTPLLDATREYVTADTAGWLRSLAAQRPYLFRPKTREPDVAAPDAQPNWAAASVTALMIGAKAKNPTALAELVRRSRTGGGEPAASIPRAPAPSASNLTSLMTAANRGDAAAKAALAARLKV